jgi:hypothetical protein
MSSTDGNEKQTEASEFCEMMDGSIHSYETSCHDAGLSEPAASGIHLAKVSRPHQLKAVSSSQTIVGNEASNETTRVQRGIPPKEAPITARPREDDIRRHHESKNESTYNDTIDDDPARMSLSSPSLHIEAGLTYKINDRTVNPDKGSVQVLEPTTSGCNNVLHEGLRGDSAREVPVPTEFAFQSTCMQDPDGSHTAKPPVVSNADLQVVLPQGLQQSISLIPGHESQPDEDFLHQIDHSRTERSGYVRGAAAPPAAIADNPYFVFPGNRPNVQPLEYATTFPYFNHFDTSPGPGGLHSSLPQQITQYPLSCSSYWPVGRKSIISEKTHDDPNESLHAYIKRVEQEIFSQDDFQHKEIDVSSEDISYMRAQSEQYNDHDYTDLDHPLQVQAMGLSLPAIEGPSHARIDQASGIVNFQQVTARKAVMLELEELAMPDFWRPNCLT